MSNHTNKGCSGSMEEGVNTLEEESRAASKIRHIYDEFVERVMDTIRSKSMDVIDKTIASLLKHMSAVIATKRDRSKY